MRCLHCTAVGSLVWHQPVAGTISEILPGGSTEGPTDAVVIESVPDDPEQRRAEQRLAALAHAARGASAPDDAKSR